MILKYIHAFIYSLLLLLGYTLISNVWFGQYKFFILLFIICALIFKQYHILDGTNGKDASFGKYVEKDSAKTVKQSNCTSECQK